jgi:acyl-CoA thioesterase-1
VCNRLADDRASVVLPLLVVWAVSVAWVSAGEPAGAWRYAPEQLRPFWFSPTMEGESVLFLQDQADARPRASLLWEPTRVLSVSSSSGTTVYQDGRDYLWKLGSKELVLPPGSAIVWKGPVPSFAGDRLPRTVQKLKDKQPLTIALLGDSISTGCNASGWAKVAPFQPPYQDLLVLHLEAVYGARVTLKNFAVGGTDTAWGLATIGKVSDARPDLVILAFGMNDSAGRPAQEYQANIRGMVDAVTKVLPDAEFILVATMLGNQDWTALRQELFPQYRDALARLGRPGVALADMTSIWTELLKHKRDWDLTGNGVNHPNDFGHRIYAQTLSALLIPAGP